MNKRVLLLTLCAATAVIGCGGSGDNKLNEDVKSETSSDQTANLKVDMSDANILKGKDIYQRTCSPCHGAGGKGDGPASIALNPKPQDHTNGAYMDKLTDGHIYTVIHDGGSIFNKPGMPPNPQLTDTDIKQVVAFVRTLSNTYKK